MKRKILGASLLVFVATILAMLAIVLPNTAMAETSTPEEDSNIPAAVDQDAKVADNVIDDDNGEPTDAENPMPADDSIMPTAWDHDIETISLQIVVRRVATLGEAFDFSSFSVLSGSTVHLEDAEGNVIQTWTQPAVSGPNDRGIYSGDTFCYFVDIPYGVDATYFLVIDSQPNRLEVLDLTQQKSLSVIEGVDVGYYGVPLRYEVKTEENGVYESPLEDGTFTAFKVSYRLVGSDDWKVCSKSPIYLELAPSTPPEPEIPMITFNASKIGVPTETAIEVDGNSKIIVPENAEVLDNVSFNVEDADGNVLTTFITSSAEPVEVSFESDLDAFYIIEEEAPEGYEPMDPMEVTCNSDGSFSYSPDGETTVIAEAAEEGTLPEIDLINFATPEKPEIPVAKTPEPEKPVVVPAPPKETIPQTGDADAVIPLAIIMISMAASYMYSRRRYR